MDVNILSTNDIIKCLEDKLYMCNIVPGRPYQDILKHLAKLHFEVGNEEKAIYYLIESHAVSLRLRTAFRMNQTIHHKANSTSDCEPSLDKNIISFDNEDYSGDLNGVMNRLQDFPPEWTIVQLTSGFKMRFGNPKTINQPPAIHLTRLHRSHKPYCVTVTLSNMVNSNVLLEQQKIISEHKREIGKAFQNTTQYWKLKQEKNVRLRSVVRQLEYQLLREWRCLLIAHLVEKTLQQRIEMQVDQILESTVETSDSHVSECVKQMLYQIALGVWNLSEFEVKKAIATSLSIDIKSPSLKDVAKEFYKLKMEFPELENPQRQPLILIVDDDLVTLPWEMMSILNGHPVTRLPSLHMIHALYKAHADNVSKGHKVNVNPEKGYYIVNPGRNLDEMEQRLKKCLVPRLPKWQGSFGVKPTSEEFSKALVDNDIFMYSGHGSGSLYLASQAIQKLRVNAVALLFGCNSMGLSDFGRRVELWSTAYSYLIGSGPCIVGTLWEVTDRDIDRFSTVMLHYWIPPTEQMKKKIEDGEEKKKVNNRDDFDFDLMKKTSKDWRQEPELLRVIHRGRTEARHFITSAALVTLGLPVTVASK